MTVSPCKNCKNEFEDKNKHPDCRVCMLPLEYANSYGSPFETVPMEVKKMNDEKAPENPQTKTITPAKDQLLEDHIKTLCEDHGMTIEEIRSGIQGSNDPDRRRVFHGTRDRIIRSLVSDEVFGRLTQVDIGKILCASGGTIAVRMQKMGISPINPRERHKKNSKTKKSKTVISSKPINQLIINFSDHQETLKKILKAAKDLMREPEAQVLFWLVHSDFEKLEGR